MRREWRSLQQTEQLAYIDAALCLTRSESTLREVGTLFDDFALVHMQVGAHCMFTSYLYGIQFELKVDSTFFCSVISMASNVSSCF